MAFHPDPRAAQLEGSIGLPLLALLRNGVWQQDTLGISALQDLLAPLIGEPGEGKPLALLRSMGTLKFELTASETAVVNAAQTGKTAEQVLREVETRKHGTTIHALRALYLFFELGAVGLKLNDGESQPEITPLIQRPMANDESPFKEETAPGIKVSSGRMTGPQHLSEYRLQLELERDGRRMLRQLQVDEAAKKFEQLVERQERPTQALAYLAVATLLQRYADRQKALELAKKALKNDAESALAHAALARAHQALEERKPYLFHRAQALSIAQHNDSWFAEVETLLSIGAEKEAKSAVSESTHKAVLFGFTALALVGLFLLANVVLMGRREYFYSGNDAFFFIRRATLLLLGILGIFLTREAKTGFWKTIGFSAPRGLLFVALAWGMLVGFLSPAQRVESSLGLVLYLTLFHVLAEEVFFRAFLTRGLLRLFDPETWQLPLVLSAVIFGVYHLSYYSFWYETALFPKVYFVGGIALLAGLPYAWLYYKSRSIVPPLICHLLVNGVMMVFSLRS